MLREHIEGCKELHQQLETKLQGLRNCLQIERSSRNTKQADEELANNIDSSQVDVGTQVDCKE